MFRFLEISVLIHYKILPGKAKELKIYLLCAPHLGSEGMHNNGEILKVNGSVIPSLGCIHMRVVYLCDNALPYSEPDPDN